MAEPKSLALCRPLSQRNEPFDVSETQKLACYLRRLPNGRKP
jgi:hypothetical protein